MNGWVSQGYSNHLEVPMVVEQARAAMYRYGVEANIRVITFYNMQKRDLEREFKAQGDVSHIPIASVRKQRREVQYAIIVR